MLTKNKKSPKRDDEGTRLSYEFNTYKLLEQDESELRANPNPFAVVALVVLMALKNKNANDEDLRLIKLDLTKELIKRKVSPNILRLWIFLPIMLISKNQK